MNPRCVNPVLLSWWGLDCDVGGRLVTVVPLSTTEPDSVEDYHCKITLAQPLPEPFENPVMWAKCDMVSAVSLDRLDRFKEPRQRYGGPRKWTVGRISAAQLKEVRCAVLCGLGLPSLTIHL